MGREPPVAEQPPTSTCTTICRVELWGLCRECRCTDPDDEHHDAECGSADDAEPSDATPTTSSVTGQDSICCSLSPLSQLLRYSTWCHASTPLRCTRCIRACLLSRCKREASTRVLLLYPTKSPDGHASTRLKGLLQLVTPSTPSQTEQPSNKPRRDANKPPAMHARGETMVMSCLLNN